ncbi:MAG: hypothetical protein CMH63_03250 [Nanoarchaeota archaeon]|jgi:hypothetical protein|nr:hypothetical protein [Nanoarchaeota archaeon]|tara:strand:- start:3630 stop:3893 length:264 start_codon:yes stop_codon:yes gene_type:complete
MNNYDLARLFRHHAETSNNGTADFYQGLAGAVEKAGFEVYPVIKEARPLVLRVGNGLRIVRSNGLGKLLESEEAEPDPKRRVLLIAA